MSGNFNDKRQHPKSAGGTLMRKLRQRVRTFPRNALPFPVEVFGANLQRAILKEAAATGANPGVVAAALIMVVGEHFGYDDFSHFPSA